MNADELTEYSTTSSLVKKYAITQSGVPSSWPYADVLDTSESVVLLDALLRRHYISLTASELSTGTGLNQSRIEELLDNFLTAGIITDSFDNGFELETTNPQVKDLREKQKDLLSTVE